ncbi:hypothetical protein [Alteromonas sp. MTD1]|uniref:hypothetical protein n=1 Tax=Alteromonas sp. MTD1 TaxID=3057962 RepID=UPI0036F2AE44
MLNTRLLKLNFREHFSMQLLALIGNQEQQTIDNREPKSVWRVKQALVISTVLFSFR